MKEIICKDGVYRCPVCKSKKVVEVCECVVFKYFNLNTKKMVNPVTGNAHMSNRDKAFSYDKAKRGLVHYFECFGCHWTDVGERLAERRNFGQGKLSQRKTN